MINLDRENQKYLAKHPDEIDEIELHRDLGRQLAEAFVRNGMTQLECVPEPGDSVVIFARSYLDRDFALQNGVVMLRQYPGGLGIVSQGEQIAICRIYLAEENAP